MVVEEPEFTEIIENVTVPAGRNVRLACSVKNLGTYKVSFVLNLFLYYLIGRFDCWISDIPLNAKRLSTYSIHIHGFSLTHTHWLIRMGKIAYQSSKEYYPSYKSLQIGLKHSQSSKFITNHNIEISV